MKTSMKSISRLGAAVALAGIVAGVAGPARAHMGAHDGMPSGRAQTVQMRPDQMRPGQMQPGQMRPGQMQPGQMRRGQMGPNMMRQMMQGMMRRMMQGMMSQGGMHMSLGMMGRRMTDRKLDAAEVRRILDGRLAWQGNKRLKLGKVTEKDADTVIAEIVTVDGSLVEKLAVDRTTGAMRSTE